MRVKKLKLFILLIAIIASMAHMSVYAAPTLDDLTSGKGDVVAEETIPYPSNYDTDSENGFFESLAGEVDFTRQEQAVVDVQKKVHSPIAIVFQMAVYGLTVAVTGKILIDLFFIMVPSFRFLFMKPEGNMMGNTPMGMRTGGIAPMAPAMPGLGGMGMPGAMGQVPIDFNRYKGVSESAIKAVERNKEPNSKGALGIYFKDTVVESVFAGTLLVLALTGVLQQIGFYLGDMIVNMIQGMM